MLMKNECSVIASIRVLLTFDDGHEKERVISTNDLVEVEYNANGLRKHIIGKVVKVSAVGTDPNGWYIIVDGSDDFDSAKARFSPTAILDVDILRKAYTLDSIQTPLDDTGIPYMRIVKGRYLQWSRDGVHWFNLMPHHHIEPAENPDDYDGDDDKPKPPKPRPHPPKPAPDDDEEPTSDGIEDAEY